METTVIAEPKAESKQSMVSVVRQLLAAHPDWKPKQVAKKAGSSIQYVYDIISKDRRKKRVTESKAMNQVVKSPDPDWRDFELERMKKKVREQEETINKLNVVVQYLEQRVMEYTRGHAV